MADENVVDLQAPTEYLLISHTLPHFSTCKEILDHTSEIQHEIRALQ